MLMGSLDLEDSGAGYIHLALGVREPKRGSYPQIL